MKLEGIKKYYKKKDRVVEVLNGISYQFEKGKIYAITGVSGSGKSTLIKILGLMEPASEGKYYLDDLSIGSDIDDRSASKIRGEKIGFIFQDYKLLPNMTVLENVMLPLLANKNIKKEQRKTIVEKLINELGIEKRKKHFPNEISGGEQQRVAIARALVNNPSYILCDEPTANLDKDNEIIFYDLMSKYKSEGKCIIIVSHSDDIYNYCDVLLKLKEGKLVNEN